MTRARRRGIVFIILTVVACVCFWQMHDGYRPAGLGLPHGAELGTHRGVAVRAHVVNIRGDYGLQHQCVELINRYYAVELGHRNMTRTGHADSYYWNAAEKDLVAFSNGGPTAPEVDDILVFDGGNNDGDPGHVAIVTEVTLPVDDRPGHVVFIQQNFTRCRLDGLFCKPIWTDNLPLHAEDDRFTVDQGLYPLPVVGWSRRNQ